MGRGGLGPGGGGGGVEKGEEGGRGALLLKKIKNVKDQIQENTVSLSRYHNLSTIYTS